MAERVGFEPTNACALPVFKTGAFNRSATSPRGDNSSPDLHGSGPNGENRGGFWVNPALLGAAGRGTDPNHPEKPDPVRVCKRTPPSGPGDVRVCEKGLLQPGQSAERACMDLNPRLGCRILRFHRDSLDGRSPGLSRITPENRSRLQPGCVIQGACLHEAKAGHQLHLTPQRRPAFRAEIAGDSLAALPFHPKATGFTPCG